MVFLKYTRRGIKNKNKKKIYQNGYIITDKENAEIIDDFSVLVRVTGFEPAASWTPFVWGRLNQIELRPIKCSDFLEKPKIPGVGLARTVKTRCMPELRIFRPSGNLLDEVFDACCLHYIWGEMFPLSSDLFCAMLTISKGTKLARSVLLLIPPER